MKELIIYGTGLFAEMADFYFCHDEGRRAVAFTTHDAFKDRDQFLGRPVLAFETLSSSFSSQNHEVFVAIGYNELNSIKRRRAADVRSAGYELTSYVSSKATLWPGFEHGDNCFILEHNNLQPFAKVGSNVTLWCCNIIGHHSFIKDDCYIAAGVTISGRVVIGEGTFVGVNATIRDGVQVGKRCVIGAGALVLRDLPDESVAAARGSAISSVPSSRLRRI